MRWGIRSLYALCREQMKQQWTLILRALPAFEERKTRQLCPRWPPPLHDSWRHAYRWRAEDTHRVGWRENDHPTGRALYQILQESLPVECLGVRQRQASLSKYWHEAIHWLSVFLWKLRMVMSFIPFHTFVLSPGTRKLSLFLSVLTGPVTFFPVSDRHSVFPF